MQNNQLKELNIDFDSILSAVPGIVYWKDIGSIYLGGNQNCADLFGLESTNDIFGKDDYHLSWGLKDRRIADEFVHDDRVVMETGKRLVVENSLGVKNSKGLEIIVRTEKTPLRDKTGKVIGVLGIAVDITESKEKEIVEREKIYRTLEAPLHEVSGQDFPNKLTIQQYIKVLESIIAKLPCYVYWKDKELRYVFCNDTAVNVLGLGSAKNILGKTDYDFNWDPKIVAEYRKVDEEIIKTGRPKLTFEETIIDTNGKVLSLLVNKMPQFNEKGDVVGIIGISIDITDRKEKERLEAENQRKEAEQLRLENELHKQALHQQEKFTKLAAQVAHDIASPTAALSMLVNACDDIPEEARLLLRNTATRINDIARNLLAQYQSHRANVSVPAAKEEVLLSANILQVLAEKKLQYANQFIDFDFQSSQKENFAFIKMESSAFKRMLSNLLNNAVDALDRKGGKVDIVLELIDDVVKITIADNGKGMPQEIVDKIMSNISITANKVDGHGIGLMQVRETLQNNQGSLSIESVINQGTKVILTFPRVMTPAWLVEEIVLAFQDIIVILDDDKSIHRAWDSRFISILKNYPGIQIKHFEDGVQALAFIQSLAPIDQQRILLLTDYELLKQELNGLDVIERSQISRSILVTSHYTNAKIRERAEKLEAKILPKQLAAEILITIK